MTGDQDNQQSMAIKAVTARESQPQTAPKAAPTSGGVTSPGVLSATLRLVAEFVRHVVVNDVLRPVAVTFLIWAIVVLAAQRANAAFIVRARNSHDALVARVAELEGAVRQWASECAECNGTGKLCGEIGFEEVCPQCEDIRAYLKVTP